MYIFHISQAILFLRSIHFCMSHEAMVVRRVSWRPGATRGAPGDDGLPLLPLSHPCHARVSAGQLGGWIWGLEGHRSGLDCEEPGKEGLWNKTMFSSIWINLGGFHKWRYPIAGWLISMGNSQSKMDDEQGYPHLGRLFP